VKYWEEVVLVTKHVLDGSTFPDTAFEQAESVKDIAPPLPLGTEMEVEVPK